MISDDKNQGKFHLLAIFLIPANIVAIGLLPLAFKIILPIISVVAAFIFLKRK